MQSARGCGVFYLEGVARRARERLLLAIQPEVLIEFQCLHIYRGNSQKSGNLKF
jgi:hypothetical protein